MPKWEDGYLAEKTPSSLGMICSSVVSYSVTIKHLQSTGNTREITWNHDKKRQTAQTQPRWINTIYSTSTTNWDHGWMVFFVVFGEDLQVTTLRQMQFHYWGHAMISCKRANKCHRQTKRQSLPGNNCCEMLTRCIEPIGDWKVPIFGFMFFSRSCCKSGGSIHRIVCLHQKHSVIHHKMSWHQKRNLRPYRWYTVYEYCYPGIPGAESLRFSCSNPQEAWTDLNVPFKIFDMGWTFWKYARRSIFSRKWP